MIKEKKLEATETLLASESALAMFVKDISHDKKKLILCLRCNVSLAFSNLSTFGESFGKHPFSERDPAGLVRTEGQKTERKDEF